MTPLRAPWGISRNLSWSAWLGHFRRPVVRYERLITTYEDFFHIRVPS